MNAHTSPENNLPNQQGSQRFLLTGFLMVIGLTGLCWLGFRYASAGSDELESLTFLEDFSAQKDKLDSELAALREKAANKQSTTKPQQKQTRQAPATPSEMLDRPGDFHAEVLQLDLTDQAIEQRLSRDAEYLSSDELEGRGIRTKGLELAGEYIASEFEKAGLYSAWYSGTPYQEFQLLNGSRRGAVQRVLFNRKNNEKYLLTPNVDFSSLMKTTMGTMTLPVVFAGYGITAPELGYDDYAGIRASGKAVIILRHEPQKNDENSAFDGAEASRYAPVYTKIQNAIAHGATAVILCDTHSKSEAAAEDDPFSSNLLKVEFSEDAFDITIPVIHCRQSLLDEVLQEFGMETLKDIEIQIDSDLRPRSRDVKGFEIGFEVARNRSGRSVRNVLASIEPNGAMPEKTIIVGAHYDHLGRDGWGSLAVGADGAIHNGADDNASGTAIIMEVARQLATKRDQLKSRVLFIAFTAEELGLLGSKHYIRDPAVPLKETVAMVNLDMVGRLREELTVYGVGTAQEWNSILLPSTEKQGLNVTGRSSGYGPSDHAVFYERGIPVLHFFTGFHPQYHRPADDSHLLNIEGMRKISRCVTDIVAQLASTETPLSPGATEEGMLASTGLADLLDQPGDTPPRFGVVVNSLPNQKGLQIKRVLPRSVAGNNGLQPGDIIHKVGETTIETIDDLKESVSGHDSGAKIPIQLTRRSLNLEIEVIF